MAPPVRALLEAQPRRDGRDRVFEFSSWHVAKAALDQRIALTPWVLHDLRRVFSTALHDRFGVPPHIVEVLLGHVGHQAGVAGVYNRSAYLAEWSARSTAGPIT